MTDIKTVFAQLVNTADSLDSEGYVADAEDLTRVAEFLVQSLDSSDADDDSTDD